MKIYEVEYRDGIDDGNVFMASTFEKALEYCKNNPHKVGKDVEKWHWAILEHELDNADIVYNCKLLTFVDKDGNQCGRVP